MPHLMHIFSIQDVLGGGSFSGPSFDHLFIFQKLQKGRHFPGICSFLLIFLIFSPRNHGSHALSSQHSLPDLRYHRAEISPAFIEAHKSGKHGFFIQGIFKGGISQITHFSEYCSLYFRKSSETIHMLHKKKTAVIQHIYSWKKRGKNHYLVLPGLSGPPKGNFPRVSNHTEFEGF